MRRPFVVIGISACIAVNSFAHAQGALAFKEFWPVVFVIGGLIAIVLIYSVSHAIWDFSHSIRKYFNPNAASSDGSPEFLIEEKASISPDGDRKASNVGAYIVICLAPAVFIIWLVAIFVWNWSGLWIIAPVGALVLVGYGFVTAVKSL